MLCIWHMKFLGDLCYRLMVSGFFFVSDSFTVVDCRNNSDAIGQWDDLSLLVTISWLFPLFCARNQKSKVRVHWGDRDDGNE